MDGSRRPPGFVLSMPLGGRLAFHATAALLLATPAAAQETTTYTYDALGRIVTSAHTGSVNAGLTQTYTHDAADNRTNVTVSGSGFTSATRVIVVPLNGLTIIPLGSGR